MRDIVLLMLQFYLLHIYCLTEELQCLHREGLAVPNGAECEDITVLRYVGGYLPADMLQHPNDLYSLKFKYIHVYSP